MMTSTRIGFSALAVALAFTLSGGAANAQLQKQPAEKAPAAATKATAKAKKAAKPKSACAGLAQDACGGNATCQWIGEHKTKAGKAIKAHCRTKPKAKAKAPAKAAAPAKANAAPKSAVQPKE
ncbi:MAG: hypothetical protein ACK5JT_02140 [Hyphomicrobiaceae bacterium]